MFKATLFFIMTFMMCLSAGAQSYVRNHEDFVHLPEYQKNQYIIKIMELSVELEDKYYFETRKYGYSQERFDKYRKALQKITSTLFIDNAYATEIYPASVRHSDWNGLATRFGEILNNGSATDPSRCIFAGWISETFQKDGKTFCGHPARMERAARGYPDPAPGSSCSRGDTNQIQCNPVIFGYKNSQSKSLFCVSTQSNAKNSSYHCMEKALGIVTEPGADSQADRLATLRTNLDTNEAAFAQVQEFVYRTCVCDSTHENFNQAYQNAVRPHRTCYGLMNMIGKTIACENPELPLENHEIFENLKNFMTNKSISEQNADGHYREFLNRLRKDTAEYRRICQIPQETPEAVSYICEEVTCTAGATQCDYKVKVAGQEGTEPVSFSERPTEMPPAAGGTFSISFKVNNVSGTATCEAPAAPATVEYECEATCLVEAPATNGDGEISTTEESDPAANQATPTGGGEGSSSTTPAQIPGCTITKLKIKPNGADIPPVIVRSPVEEAQADPRPLNFTLKIDNEDKQVSCLTTVTQISGTTTPDDNTDDNGGEETTDGTAPKLTVTIEERGTTAYKIKAVSENDTGWIFKWSSTPPTGKNVEKSWEAAVVENSTPAVAVAGADTEESEEGTPAEGTPETSDGKEISQKRYDFAYDVCGTLTKTDKEPIQKCVTVDKLGSATGSGNRVPNVNPNLRPGGGGPPRGSSDASAIGIR